MPLRKFVTYDGEVLDELEWSVTPIHKCFYCDTPVDIWKYIPSCPMSQAHEHEFVTLCDY
jgi:hypothetical protein